VPGARVRLQGLSVAELNGQIGVLEAFQDERWAVRLESGEGKRIRPVNLVLTEATGLDEMD
jgi:hypothetical protein